jgi:hypothetical protein
VRRAFSLLCVLACASDAWGAEGTEIASAFDEGHPFPEVYIGVDYFFESKRAAIKREYAGLDPSMTDGPVPIVKDLVFKQTRHVITPHLQIGLFHDLQLSLTMPIIVSDNREFELDQRADPCIFPGDPQMREPTCIDNRNSSTLRDNLLPGFNGAGPLGYDANDPMSNFASDSTTVFRGVGRAGIDQLHVGLAWAPMVQKKDDTKPTWVIGAEGRFSIGKIMKFNRFSPDSEDGVSRGVHEVKVWTSLSRQTTWSEPFVTFWWMSPFDVRGRTPAGTDGDVGFGQETFYPQQSAGATFGFEAIPWEQKERKQKISVELRGRVEAHFEGRNYSEMWEIFSYAGDSVNNPSGPLVLDENPITMGVQPLSHPGTTDVENYMTFAGRLGVRGWVGKNAKFSASFEVTHDQQHRISWTDAGDEFPGCDGTNGPDCEDPNDDVITPGTGEVNPLHKQVMDVVGRRYIVDENTTYTFLISGTIMF